MPMKGFITRSAAALLLALALLASPAQASECGRLCDEAFWQTATPQQVEAEIKAGANPNGRDEGGFTPLHQAAFWEKPEAIKALVRAGADLEAKTNTTTFHGAPPLHWAARGRIAATVALLDAGADPNSREIDGWTPLHQAAQYGTDKIIKSLVQAGANLNARDKNGWSPLHRAAYWGKAEMVEALLDAGANPKARDEDGKTPLYAAAYGGIAEIVNALLNAGANLEARAKYGLTPLHGAAGWGTAGTVEALARAGANLEARDENGWSPLHRAAYWGTAQTVKALLDAGANPKARDEDGRTPFDLAKDNDKLTGTDAWWRLHDAQFD